MEYMFQLHYKSNLQHAHHLFHVIVKSLLLPDNISERNVWLGHVPVVHEWHLTVPLWVAIRQRWSRCGHVRLAPVC